MTVWLLAKVHERGLRLQLRLYAGSVGVAQCCCSYSMQLVVLEVSLLFTFAKE